MSRWFAIKIVLLVSLASSEPPAAGLSPAMAKAPAFRSRSYQ